MAIKVQGLFTRIYRLILHSITQPFQWNYRMAGNIFFVFRASLFTRATPPVHSFLINILLLADIILPVLLLNMNQELASVKDVGALLWYVLLQRGQWHIS